jgi:nucleoside-diphosphate-sugar epimerase
VITGSSGFIGKYMLSELKESSFDIIEIDVDKGHNLNDSNCLDYLRNVDYFIHLASHSFVPASFENPYIFYRENFIMTLNVLEAAKRLNSKVIFFSSYLYGSPAYLPIDENHPLLPHNPYAESKLICEKLCEGYNRDFGLDVVVFRPFNIYGKGQNPAFILPSIIQQSQNGIVKLIDPRPKRDFIHVLDVVCAARKVIELKLDGYHVFNIGYGKSYSIDEVTKTISEILQNQLHIQFTHEYRKGEVLDTVANISRAKNMLMWEPEIDLNSGLRQMIE